MASRGKIKLTKKAARTSVGRISGVLKKTPGVSKVKLNNSGKGGYHICALFASTAILKKVEQMEEIEQIF